jgi:prophage antirepressor-like protein
MAGIAEKPGSSLKRRSPGVQARAPGNESNFQEENVMANNSTAATNVIPFRFEAKEVRTILVDDQPWFAAKDIIASLGYAKSSAPAKLTDHVPAQWKGVNLIHTPGGTQKVLMLSEQGLYFFLGRSDKPKALPFQMWLAGEVLPAIRKHGRYEEPAGKMAGIMNDLLLTPAHQRHVLDRVAELAGRDRKKFPTVWRSIKAHFKVASYKQIPDSQYPALCEFMMCMPLGGEYLPKQEDVAFQLTDNQAMDLSHLLHSVAWFGHRWGQGIGQGLQYLNRDLYASTFEHVDSMRRASLRLDESMKSLLQEIDQRYKFGGRRPEAESIAA